MVLESVLADLIVFGHVLFVAFVVLSLPVILWGRACRWQWISNPLFRLTHIAAIGVVVLMTWLGMECPLTTWENALRLRAGQSQYPGDFIGYWLHEILFFELPPSAFTVAYSLFGAAVVLSLWIAPPRWSRGICHGAGSS